MNFDEVVNLRLQIIPKDLVIKMYPSEIRAGYKPGVKLFQSRQVLFQSRQVLFQSRQVLFQRSQVLFQRSQEFYATLNRYPWSFLAKVQIPFTGGTLKEKQVYVRYLYAQQRWRWYMRTEGGHKPNRNAAKPWGIIRDDAYDYLKSNPLIKEVLLMT